MKLSLHAVIALCALTFAYAGFFFLSPTAFHRLGLDFWAERSEAERLRIQLDARRKLDDDRELIGQRLALRNALVHELIEERITLAEAVEQFHSLNQSDPRISGNLPQAFPAPTIEESTALQVFGFASAELEKLTDDPGTSFRLMEQLAELRSTRFLAPIR